MADPNTDLAAMKERARELGFTEMIVALNIAERAVAAAAPMIAATPESQLTTIFIFAGFIYIELTQNWQRRDDA